MDDQRRDRAVRALRSALDFAKLDEGSLQDVVARSLLRDYGPGEVVFEKGDRPEALYVVVSGAVAIGDVVHGEERRLAMIGPGDFFGEVGVALHVPRTRAARADQASEILVVPAEVVRSLASAHPHLEARLIEAFGDRATGREERAAE